MLVSPVRRIITADLAGRYDTAVAGTGLFACVLAIGLLFTRGTPESYDAQIMLQVTQSLVDHGTFTVHRDPFAMNVPYSYYGIGMSLLMALPYWAAEHLRQAPGPWVMSVNAVVVAAVAVTAFALGLATGMTRLQSLAASLLTAFGTLLLPYVATGFSEPAIALAIALGLLAVRTRHPALAGAAGGLALLMRTDSALLVVPVLAAAAWIAGGRGRRPALRFGFGLLPAVAVVGAYNALRFGAPWRSGYFLSFNHPLPAGLYGLLFSPAAGLFLYVPLLVAALAGLALGFRRERLLVTAAVLLLAARIPFYAIWFGWQAYWAWGPRYLVPAMPALAIGLLEICRRWRGLAPPLKVGLAALCALSVAVQVVGAAIAYEHAAMFAALLHAHPAISGPGFIVDEARPATEAIWDRVEFDWSLWPIPDEARDLLSGRHLAGHWLAPAPNGGVLAVLLAVAGAGLAAAALAARRRPASQTATAPS